MIVLNESILLIAYAAARRKSPPHQNTGPKERFNHGSLRWVPVPRRSSFLHLDHVNSFKIRCTGMRLRARGTGRGRERREQTQKKPRRGEDEMTMLTLQRSREPIVPKPRKLKQL